MNTCNSTEREEAEIYRNYFVGNVTKIVKGKPRRAGYFPACIIHGLSQGIPFNSPNWQVPQNSGNTVSKIMNDFITDNYVNDSYILYSDNVSWPFNTGCNNLTNLLIE